MLKKRGPKGPSKWTENWEKTYPKEWPGVLLDSIILRNNEFDKEKDLALYLQLNMNVFVEELLEDKLVAYELERPVNAKIRTFATKTPRMDIWIKGEKSNYIIELKNPSAPVENRYAIGQILDYGREEPEAEMILITTLFDMNTAKTIKHYNLPIRYIYFEKSKFLEYKNHG